MAIETETPHSSSVQSNKNQVQSPEGSYGSPEMNFLHTINELKHILLEDNYFDKHWISTSLCCFN